MPRCPNLRHKGSKVVRDGWYGKPPHRRQRWRCAPANGDPPHRFTPTLTRQTHFHAAPNGYCLECSTAVEPWEGQAGARTYLFAAREVGDALALVAQGNSYRSAAARARIQADRVKAANPRSTSPTSFGPTVVAGVLVPKPKRKRQRVAQEDGLLVANWVDVFTPLICDGLLPERWPDVLLIDSKAYQRGHYQRARRFNILAASGIEEMPTDRLRRVPKAWRIRPYASKNLSSWTDFLSSLQGTPKVIVSDLDPGIQKAIDAVFPRPGDPPPEHRYSEFHVKRLLEEYLPAGSIGVNRPIGLTYDACLTGARRWADFLVACDEQVAADPKSMVRALKFIDRYGDHIAAQVATRRPELPNSTGAVEADLRELDKRIGDRAASFTNRARMCNLLDLITADLRRPADGRRWADRLRERVYLAGGHPRPQRPHDDPRHYHSLYV